MERFAGLLTALSGDIDSALEYQSSKTDPHTGKIFALHRLRERFRKRMRIGSKNLAEDALVDFVNLNEYASTIRPYADPFILHNARLFIEESFERFNKRRDPELIQCSFDQRVLLDYWRFGPGASRSIRGTHVVEKILQPMTCTVACEQLVRNLRDTNLYFRSYDAIENRPVHVVSGSRLTTVPKNEECERTIAIEPSGNMLLQLAVEGYVRDVLKMIGCNIETQSDLNRGLARMGSIDGCISTIDLKSASDLITPALCRMLLPRPLYNFMCRIRSTHVDIGGRSYQLNMMSTMGNGFTFPIMTLILISLVYAVRLRNGGPSRYIDWSLTGVFGDDIIVPTAEASDLIHVLEGLGLIVNHDKSYTTGSFRESCGGDFFEGYNVTPFYIKELSHDHDVYVALNQVLDYCGSHGFVFDRTLCYLRSLINDELFFVPEWHSDTDGVRTSRVSHRYKHLKAKQVRRLVPEGHHFSYMLACGGYIDGCGPHTYTPRPRGRVEYKVRRSRLPNGYLDGRDVAKRNDRCSEHINSWLFLLE